MQNFPQIIVGNDFKNNLSQKRDQIVEGENIFLRISLIFGDQKDIYRLIGNGW